MTPTLVIMAAGLGRRFGGPKQLAPVGPSGEALLDYALLDGWRAGFRHAVIVIRAELEDAMNAHLARFAPPHVPVSLVRQRLDDLPAWCLVPEGRSRPWGTGQAVLAARDAVGESRFAVCNADDWYGPESYQVASRHLTISAGFPSPVPVHALVSYRLDQTLSSEGGVARGVVQEGRDHQLVSIDEVQDLRAVSDGVEGRLDGAQVHYRGAEIASMNLWAFHPEALSVLAAQFEQFLMAHGQDVTAEFPLSTAMGQQVAAGHARVRVLRASDSWAGMTYASELEQVRALIAARVRAGDYPMDIASAFG
jgi:hypothetical protein